jgi:hypothetical protein
MTARDSRTGRFIRRRDRHDAGQAGQWLASLRTGPHDATTVPVPPGGWQGASATGVMPGPDTEPFPAPEPRPRPRAAAPPPETDPAPVADALAAGWPHLFEVRCQYPAAPHDTPIPCDTAPHRDDRAGSIRALRRSAQAAGWHLDALGRWTCPPCQMGSQYRTLYPVTVRAGAGPAGRAEHDLALSPELREELDRAEFRLRDDRYAEWVQAVRAGQQRARHRAVTR